MVDQMVTEQDQLSLLEHQELDTTQEELTDPDVAKHASSARWHWRLAPKILALCIGALAWRGSSKLLFNESALVQLQQPPLALLCCDFNGVCLEESMGGTCCPGEFPTICPGGSTCYQGTGGAPFCCEAQAAGCSGTCVIDVTRNMIQRKGGTCNGHAENGLTLSQHSIESVLPLPVPWDPIAHYYDFDGRSAATINVPLHFGTGPFTLDFTITPKYDGSITVAGQTKACIFSKRKRTSILGSTDSSAQSGFLLCFVDHLVNGTRSHSMLDFTYSDGIAVAGIRLNEAGQDFTDFFMDMPIRFTIVANATHNTCFVNGVRVKEAELIPFNRGVAPDNDAPLTIGAEVTQEQLDGPWMRRDMLNGGLSKLKWRTTADFPDL